MRRIRSHYLSFPKKPIIDIPPFSRILFGVRIHPGCGIRRTIFDGNIACRMKGIKRILEILSTTDPASDDVVVRFDAARSLDIHIDYL
jgi:hypothetical protein